ncbi:MAG TPA: hypothetical protein VJP86_08970 [Vicinamibacterales bacterium]|nr:hypothetical protein [Vicinamibacterales bacterium]
MKTTSMLPLVATLLLLSVAPAAAQESNKFGVTMGYPSSVGLVWHATRNIAVRPEISFSHSSTDAKTTISIPSVPCAFCDVAFPELDPSLDASSTSWDLNISGLFYLSEEGLLRVYGSPRFGWSHVTSKIDSDGALASLDGLADLSRSYTTYHAAGSFGVQFAVHPKLSVFGEAGVQMDWSGDDPVSDGFNTLEISTRSYSSRTAVGVIFYFGK